MKQSIINFLSTRGNLTLFHCVLYGIIGYIMGQHLTWIELGIMFAIIFLIQFITRTKAVADGMVFRQMMIDLNCDANEIAKKMKDEVDKINKKDLN